MNEWIAEKASAKIFDLCIKNFKEKTYQKFLTSEKS